MTKIIHLSDLHVGYQDLESGLSQLVTRLINRLAPAGEHLVIITGDTVEDATREDLYARASLQLDRLRDAGFRVLIVPGNHDYGTGTLGYARYVERFKSHFFGDPATSYPKVDIVDGIACIGLDSMAEELHWYDRLFAEGELGSPQLQRLIAVLASEPVASCRRRVVYLHHHPFHPRPLHSLKDSVQLGTALAGRGIDALLFGHNHDGLAWHGHWGIPRVYDAGSSTGKRGRVGPIRIIDLERDPSTDEELPQG